MDADRDTSAVGRRQCGAMTDVALPQRIGVLSLPPQTLDLVVVDRAPLNVLNSFVFLTPIFAVAISAIWYSEQLSIMQGAGGALTLAGAWLATRGETVGATDP